MNRLKKIFVLTFLFFVHFLNAQPIVFNISGSNVICNGNAVTLDAGNYATYNWSTGETTQTILVATGGTYGVTVTDGGTRSGSASKTVTEGNPTLTIQGSDFVCSGRKIVLDAGSFDSYSWSNSLTTRSIDVVSGGTYSVTVTDFNGCTASASKIIGEETFDPPGLPRITFLCPDDSLVLDGTVAGAISYLWNDQSTAPTLVVRDSGTYNVIISNGRCVAFDTAFVDKIPNLSVNLGGDTLICTNSALTLKAFHPYATNYIWSDSSRSPSLSVNKAGVYGVTISRGTCVATDTIQVGIYNQKSGVQLDTVVCNDTSYTIQPILNGTRLWIWKTGDSTNTLRVKKDGNYQVLATNGGCYAALEYRVRFQKTPDFGLGKDSILCSENTQSYLLKADSSNATSYVWQDSSRGSFYLATKPYEKIWVRATNQCGSVSDTAYIGFKSCYSVFVPNAFSPNGDGENDILELSAQPNEVIKIETFKIFDRWGTQVFEANDFSPLEASSRAWDGGWSRAKQMPVGVYIYLLKYKHRTGIDITQSGDINLLK
ncbi:MAG: hypothetical protein RL757_3395 [Bacteroidota bacterium]